MRSLSILSLGLARDHPVNNLGSADKENKRMFEIKCNVFTDTPTTFNKNGVISFDCTRMLQIMRMCEIYKSKRSDTMGMLRTVFEHTSTPTWAKAEAKAL